MIISGTLEFLEGMGSVFFRTNFGLLMLFGFGLLFPASAHLYAKTMGTPTIQQRQQVPFVSSLRALKSLTKLQHEGVVSLVQAYTEESGTVYHQYRTKDNIKIHLMYKRETPTWCLSVEIPGQDNLWNNLTGSTVTLKEFHHPLLQRVQSEILSATEHN